MVVMTNFTGISDSYEEPQCPEVTVKTPIFSVEECVKRVMQATSELGYTLVSYANGGAVVSRRVSG